MEPSDAELEATARRRVETRTGFALHAVLFVVVNTGLVLIWSLTRGYPWFVWPLLGWGVALLIHAVTLVIGPDSPREERAVQRELQRLRTREST
jgi:fatty acid desaturase